MGGIIGKDKSETRVSPTPGQQTIEHEVVEKLPKNVSEKEEVDEQAKNSEEPKRFTPRLEKQKSMKLKKRAFRRTRMGFDLGSRSEDNFVFLLDSFTAREKDAEDKERLGALLSNETLDFIGEDVDWILDEMREAQIASGTILFKQGQMCPYFFVVHSGKFRIHNTDVVESNVEALFYPKLCDGDLCCEEGGTIWFLSKLQYQQKKVDHLRAKIAKGESLLNNIREIPGLRDLPKDQLQQLASSLKHVRFEKGDLLLEKGRDGSCMYFIQDGHVVITAESIINYRRGSISRWMNETEIRCTQINVDDLVADNNGKQIVAERGPGEYIGEGALLESLGKAVKTGTRNASVVAKTNVSCLVLERNDFETHMGSLKELFEHNFIARILESVSILKTVPEIQLFSIASLLEERIYEHRTFVVSQGETGSEFFIVKDGTLECTLETNESEDVSIGSLLPGDYFGEGALLTQEPRRCNVVVVGNKPAYLWVLQKHNFEKCLSSDIKHKLKANFGVRKADPTDQEAAEAKMKFDDLQTIRTLGSGSYGTVDLVRNKITGYTYALKQIRKVTVLAKKQQRFIQNERELLTSLSSKFVIQLFQTFKTDSSVYMLCEVCLGGELYTFMKKAVDKKLADAGIDASNMEEEEDDVFGCFDLGIQARFFLACIILAIEYIHSQGIVHRDLKPENLMISNNGYLKLVDFGFAKRIFSQRTYSLCGTPEYTAPEVFKRIGHGKQVDYWAIGVILYEMASGFSPFHIESQNSWDCFQEISKYEKFYPKIQFPSTFPPSLESLLLRLMHPSPLKRYGSLKVTSVELKEHEFFQACKDWEAIDWNQIEEQNFELPPEHCPKTAEYSLDASNFVACKDRHAKDHEKVPLEIIENDFTGWDDGF